MWKVKDVNQMHIIVVSPNRRLNSLPSSGQVRQMRAEEEAGQHKATHITIPATYSSGITIFALRESDLGRELLEAPALPLLWGVG